MIPEIPGQLGMSMTTGTVKLGMLMLEMFGMSGMLEMLEMFGMSGMSGMLEMVIERRMYTRKKPVVMAETT